MDEIEKTVNRKLNRFIQPCSLLYACTRSYNTDDLRTVYLLWVDFVMRHEA